MRFDERRYSRSKMEVLNCYYNTIVCLSPRSISHHSWWRLCADLSPSTSFETAKYFSTPKRLIFSHTTKILRHYALLRNVERASLLRQGSRSAKSLLIDRKSCCDVVLPLLSVIFRRSAGEHLSLSCSLLGHSFPFQQRTLDISAYSKTNSVSYFHSFDNAAPPLRDIISQSPDTSFGFPSPPAQTDTSNSNPIVSFLL